MEAISLAHGVLQAKLTEIFVAEKALTHTVATLLLGSIIKE